MTADEKSPDWTEKEVREVLKSLKNNKAKDPLGFINELFKTQGEDLVKSLVLMMNRIKNLMAVPEVFHMKNVTSLFKNKGSRSDLKNDRGIFNCTILNSLLQKLLLKKNYDVIDSNLTDSNCGSRKGKISAIFRSLSMHAFKKQTEQTKKLIYKFLTIKNVLIP